jgi:hypothetical protein
MFMATQVHGIAIVTTALLFEKLDADTFGADCRTPEKRALWDLHGDSLIDTCDPNAPNGYYFANTETLDVHYVGGTREQAFTTLLDKQWAVANPEGHTLLMGVGGDPNRIVKWGKTPEPAYKGFSKRPKR